MRTFQIGGEFITDLTIQFDSILMSMSNLLLLIEMESHDEFV